MPRIAPKPSPLKSNLSINKNPKISAKHKYEKIKIQNSPYLSHSHPFSLKTLVSFSNMMVHLQSLSIDEFVSPSLTLIFDCCFNLLPKTMKRKEKKVATKWVFFWDAPNHTCVFTPSFLPSLISNCFHFLCFLFHFHSNPPLFFLLLLSSLIIFLTAKNKTHKQARKRKVDPWNGEWWWCATYWYTCAIMRK